MKKIIYKHRKILRALIALPLLVFFISYGCQTNGNEKNTSQMNYSGEEIFKGIFFLQGPLPNKIEALKSEYEKSKASMATNKEVGEFQLEFSKEIIKSINTLDPSFFKQFKEQMESKNYYAVQLAVANASKMLKAGGYNSKYSNLFKLSDELESKKADLPNEFKDFDINSPQGLAKYKSLMKTKYDIDLDDENYKIACAPSLGFCIVVVVVAGFALAVAVSYVYNLHEYWGGVKNQNMIENVLIEELATKLGSSNTLLSSS